MRYLQWILLSVVGVFFVCIVIFLVLRAGSIIFTSGPHKVIASDDVIWLLPWENGRYSEDPGFIYEGASEKGGVLTVDGKFYGTLTTGDSVDLSTKGVVASIITHVSPLGRPRA